MNTSVRTPARPSTPTGTTARGAFRGRISTEPIVAHARTLRPTDRTSAGSEPLLPQPDQGAPRGTRRPPPPAPWGLKWYQRPWVPRADRCLSCLVSVASAILPPLETAVTPEGGLRQHRRHRPVQKFAPGHAVGIEAGDKDRRTPNPGTVPPRPPVDRRALAIDLECQAALDQPRAANEAQRLLVMDAACDLAISASSGRARKLALGRRGPDRPPMTSNAAWASSAWRASSRRCCARRPPSPALVKKRPIPARRHATPAGDRDGSAPGRAGRPQADARAELRGCD
jgi:hypothetical protein